MTVIKKKVPPTLLVNRYILCFVVGSGFAAMWLVFIP